MNLRAAEARGSPARLSSGEPAYSRELLRVLLKAAELACCCLFGGERIFQFFRSVLYLIFGERVLRSPYSAGFYYPEEPVLLLPRSACSLCHGDPASRNFPTPVNGSEDIRPEDPLAV